MHSTRREWLVGWSAIGAAALLTNCGKAGTSGLGEMGRKEHEDKGAGEVTATEDLMREHGVLRRALLVYHETVLRARSGSDALHTEPLQRAAKLFRDFGEEYHEKKLEEAYILPAFFTAGKI